MHRRHVALWSFCLALVVGCNSRPAAPSTVRGHIYFRGVALNTGTVVFTPHADRGSRGPLAWAEIQPDGSYLLFCEDKPEVQPGWYRVTVVAAVPTQNLLPSRYRDPDLSGLECEVKAIKENTLDFHLD